jgi:hypothetical protein
MKIEDQVCGLELAKKLKELGVKQESIFLWVKDKPTKEYHLWSSDVYAIGGAFPTKDLAGADIVSAFTAAELGEMLPWGLYMDEEGQNGEALTMYKDSAYQWNFYPRHGKFHKIFNCTEAEARAKMFIYLIEHGLISR